MALAGTAGAATLSCSSLALPQDGDDESVPAFPEGGFPSGSVRIGFNENPLGPSPKALRAILESGLTEGHRYNYIDPLIESIAKHHSVPTENVAVGCGSTEFLQFTPWAFLKPTDSLVIPDPSYGYMAGVAESIGADVFRVPLAPMGHVDIEQMKKAIRSDTKIVYIANPNNPTGASVPIADVRSLVETLPEGSILFVDEAYHDFLPDESALSLVKQGLPVIVARTFSKAYGMAGLRLGYAIAPDDVMKQLKTAWWGDFGINTAANIAGPVALADQDHVRKYVQVMDEGREQLKKELTQMGYRPFPHRAPFFMVDLGKVAKSTRLALYHQKIYVQDGNNWKMPNFLRVSVGLPKENEAFLKAMHEMRSL